MRGCDLSLFFQAEDGIRDFCLSRGLGDVYKRQDYQGILVKLTILKVKREMGVSQRCRICLVNAQGPRFSSED